MRSDYIQGLKTVVQMSLRDYLHERLLSACAVLGLAAVLAPLLVLFGVKSGMINTMADRLIEDPRNREISPVGSGRYGEAWFSEVAELTNVAFVIPQTRSIAASMVIYDRKESGMRSTAVDLIPTGEGDPLLEKWGKIPATETEIVLSEPAARKLEIVAGREVVGRIGRSVRGIKEQVTVKLKVAAVLPIEAFTREAAFIRLQLLEATENYRDGWGSETFGWVGKSQPTRPKVYPSFRMYARSIYDVADLRGMFNDQGIEVYAKVEEIEVVQGLDRSFTLIFRLIAVVAIFGYFASMASNFLANVKRKSRHLGVTRLIGFSTRSIVWFPIVQSIATSLMGTVTAICLYLITATLINRVFSEFLSADEYVCRLSLTHFLIALCFTLAMSILASAYAAFRVARIEPTEVIRDV
jgi:putative ABC transport system permease protein